MAQVWPVNVEAPDAAMLAEAAALVRQGGLVAFPTETVYGLAANAEDPKAMERLNRVKGRPPEKPYSIHLAEASQVRTFVKDIPPLAARLMEALWPGPLTIVMTALDGKTIGFRVPDHPVARQFLARCGCTVVAPSANRSGVPPPTDAKDVLVSLAESIDGILDAGPTPLGRESTVVSVVGNQLRVLREGTITAQALETVLQQARATS